MQLLQGDCFEVMQGLADNSVDLVLTDPPAGIGFMNCDWDKDKGGRDSWIKWMADIAAECLRVTKPGGHALVWALPRTSHWTATAWENGGWQPRDKIAHVFGTGFPKSHNGPWGGTALKPAMEDWWLLRKPLIGTVAANFAEYGTGALNIDACRVGTESYLTGQRLSGTMIVKENTLSWEPEKNLCNSCAKHAENKEKQATRATKECSAISSAEQTSSAKGKSIQSDLNKTDIGCSGGQNREAHDADHKEDLSLSTSEYGERQTAMFQPGIASTTKTMTASTIGLKICALCASEITSHCTSENTTQEKKNLPQEQSSNGNAAPAGRWPSNLIHDGSEEVLALFPMTKSGKAGFAPRKGGNVYGGNSLLPSATIHQGGMEYGDSGSAARFFYCAKASKRERDAGLEGMTARFAPTMGNGIGGKEHDPKTATYKRNTHPTVKPIALMEYLVQLASRPGAVVLDPFMGSGTTGIACRNLGREFIGIEMDEAYFEIAKRRIGVQLAEDLF